MIQDDSHPAPAPGPALAPHTAARRAALLRLAAWSSLGLAGPLSACGGGGGSGGASPAPAPVAPAPPPPTPPVPPPVQPPPPTVQRLKAALLRPALQAAASGYTVTQGPGNDASSGFGSNARFLPAFSNGNTASLAEVAEVWGHRRDTWTAPAPGVARISGVNVFPVQRRHPAATLASEGVCALHFRLQGRAFEVLMAGIAVNLTVVVDGALLTGGWFDRSWGPAGSGASLSAPNAMLRFDFGSRAAREVSVYARSSQGPCALIVDAQDSLQPWDRSAEAAMGAMADSYGGAPGQVFSTGGPLWEAAARLGIAHIDINAIGGTGYAPNSVPGRGNPGDAFEARLASCVRSAPDLFITAGGINDNNSQALFPYATAQAARDGFEAAVRSYHRALRTALPQAVLVGIGPWAPRESVPPEATALAKAEAVRNALAEVGGPWIFLDNLRGGWTSSAGAGSAGSGPWQTGTGTVAAPTGRGNGDLYVSADGTHPTVAGVVHLGTQIAEGIRAGLASL
ncbi:SGNH/GDSL hydrolase family protein [Rubrivivax rivuli]|uniref:SGNH/GDSL hydrolase family protein n=1 Tax=Rubrivivax rivuli TaxID=1862385 RepID=A0A437REE0_9BURK|nr:SGNH/GDSL hydrolase family protein [Rubrivivax rivuli]RVU45082.1 SGNH/GDSL hydrolase family protein [Rubrivivax rivuli]